MTIYSQSFDFSLINCPVCSIPYGVLASMADRKGLTCPNGHSGNKPVIQVYGDLKPDLTPIRSIGPTVGPVGITATRLAQPEHQPSGPQIRPTPVSELRGATTTKPPLKGRTLDIYEYMQEHPTATSDRLAAEFSCTVPQAGAALAYISRWQNMTSDQLEEQKIKLQNMRKAQETENPSRFMRAALVEFFKTHPGQEFTRSQIAGQFNITENHASATLSILANRGVIQRVRSGVFQSA